MQSIRQAIICITTIFFCNGISLNAQPASFTNAFNDRKAKALAELKKHSSPDTARVNALLKVLYTATFMKERAELEPYRVEAMELSRRLDYRRGMAECYGYAGSYYKSNSDYPSAIKYYDSALYIIGDAGDPHLTEMRSLIYQRKGMIYQFQENYYPALNNFFASLKSTNDEPRIIRLNIFITEIYGLLNNLDKAYEYARRNIDIIERNPEPANTPASVYLSAINIFLDKNKLDSASLYLDKLVPYVSDTTEGQVRFGYFLKRGHVYFKKDLYGDAFSFYKQAHQQALKGGHGTSVSTALYWLSATALKAGNNNLARDYALENLSLTDSTNTKGGRMAALKVLADYYHAVGNDKESYKAMAKSQELKDSLMAEMNIRQVNVLGAIYERETQLKEISLLQHEKDKQAAAVKQKSTLNKVFIGSIITLLVLGYLGFMNFRKGQQLAKNKEMLQKQEIIQLEKDKQFLSVDAMLRGQEEERSRIAKDLHDGLGGLLSGAKLSFVNIKEKLPLTPESKFLFEKSLSMLDNTIVDLRKIAQNLLPEALVKYGLHDALHDFCDSIRASTGINTIYQQFGEQRKLHTTAAVFIYRIIQELVNNVIKHASASQVMVQLAMSENTVSITVEDDGKGFDIKKVNLNNGSGMANINYRVQYFNGTVDLITSPGGGTSVNIQLIA